MQGHTDDLGDCPAIDEQDSSEYEARRAWAEQQPPLIDSLDQRDAEDIQTVQAPPDLTREEFIRWMEDAMKPRHWS